MKTVAFPLALMCSALMVAAQTSTPSAEQMIEQLKAPRTRGLRNLSVEAVQPATEPVPVLPSSLSLLIQFDFNSARVRPASQQALINLSSAL